MLTGGGASLTQDIGGQFTTTRPGDNLQGSSVTRLTLLSFQIAVGKTMMFRVVLIVVGLAASLHAQLAYPPELAGAQEVVYRTVGDVSLKMWIYQPSGHQAESDSRPAVVFFFGGGWKSGTPAQFESQCRYLASRGIVAATADYRVATRHGVKADACVLDAKAAVRWLRTNAADLGIDPDRICAGGGSAGGHIACCAGVITELEEDSDVSSVPNAMALFNPAVILAPLEGFAPGERSAELFKTVAERTGVDPRVISPIHHVRKGLPPTIIFHGKADPTVPYATVEEFTHLMQKAGNRCELKGFAEAPHGFFNPPRGKDAERRDRADQWHRRTTRQLDEFLQSLGWLKGPATMSVVDEDFVSLRGSVTNSLAAFKSGTGHVAFLGGSITEMNGYRPMICDWLQKRFPGTKFTFTNAGIASTCSTTGAMRLKRDVLGQGPVDLLFVEFAVNDDQDAGHKAADCVRGMEGIIRQVRAHNSRADIIMTHFVNPGMLNALADGKKILSATQHERVAAHYGVSSVYLSKELSARIAEGQTTWREFGGTHPKEPGNRMAADLAVSILEAGWLLNGNNNQKAHAVPEPLDPTSYSGGRLLPQGTASLANGWKLSEPDWSSLKGGKRNRFTGRPLIHSNQSGAVATVLFRGTAIGAYIVAGPDAGVVEYRVDDGDWKSADLYHRFSRGLHYPRTVMFENGLADERHTLELRLADKQQAGRGAVRILNFVVND